MEFYFKTVSLTGHAHAENIKSKAAGQKTKNCMLQLQEPPLLLLPPLCVDLQHADGHGDAGDGNKVPLDPLLSGPEATLFEYDHAVVVSLWRGVG